jgi:hypothetical protein
MRTGRGVIRWTAVCLATAALLILAAGAYGSAFFKGPVAGGANNAGVEFRVKAHHHHPRKVLEFRWFNVPVPPQCADSFEGTHFSMKVKRHRRFHGTYSVPNTDHKAIVHGRFKRSGKKATGTLRLKGNFAGGCVNADTGALHWVATKNG